MGAQEFNPAMFGLQPGDARRLWEEAQQKSFLGLPQANPIDFTQGAASVPTHPNPNAGTQTAIPPQDGPSMAEPQPPMSDVDMAQTMLMQSAQGTVADPTQANLLAAQSTYVLPNGQVVDAATAQRLMQGGRSVNPAAMRQYQAVSGEADKARSEADDLRRQIGSSAMVVGESGRLQAENASQNVQQYMNTAVHLEHQAAQSQQEYQQRFTQFERQLEADKAKYDQAVDGLSGPKGLGGIAEFGRGIGMAVAAGLGAKAAVLGNTKNFAMEAINQSIERDMSMRRDQVAAAGQRMNMTRQMYQDYRQKYGDDAMARQATLATAKDILASKLTKEAELHKGTELYEKSLQFAKSLELEAAQNRANALDLAGQAIYKQVYTNRPGMQLKTSAEWLKEQAALKSSINQANKAGQGADNLSDGSQNRIANVVKRTAKLVEAEQMFSGLSQQIEGPDPSGMANRVAGSLVSGLRSKQSKTLELDESKAKDALINYWTGAGFSRAEAEAKAEQVAGSGAFTTNATKALHYKNMRETVRGLLHDEILALGDAEKAELMKRMEREGINPTFIKQLLEGRPENREAEAETFLGIR